MRWTRTIACTLSAFVAGLLLLHGSVSAQAPPGGRGEKVQRPPFRGADPALRRGLFEAWKASRGRRDPLHAVPESIRATLATSTVGRPSLVINASGQILFSKQFPPSSCDPEPGRCGPNGRVGCAGWSSDNTYNAGDIVRPRTGNTDSVLFQAQNSGLSGGGEPNWPTTAGLTVVDGAVTWLAIGFDPTMFNGCSAMQLISRASGGAETVIAQEGDNVGGGQNLLGWGEFYAFNDNGVAAFKAPFAGILDENDEASVGLVTAGPGPGNLSVIARTGQVIGGLQVWGISPMVAINNAGQVLFDGYGQFLRAGEATWQPNTAYPSGRYVLPTAGGVLEFFAGAACTSGAVEPTWPTRTGLTVADGTCTWSNRLIDGDEQNHNLIRFTPGPGNEFLFGTGTDVGGATVTTFGEGCGFQCEYDNIDGLMNASGHTSTVVTLSTGETAAYLVTGPLAFTEVARTNGFGPGGFYFGTIHARTALNDSDSVLFLADLNSGSARTPVRERQRPSPSPAVGFGTNLIRWTPPATYDVLATEGDDIGLLEGGAATGETIDTIGYFGDINNPGNVVFQAALSSGVNALFFWDHATGFVSEIAREGNLPAQLSPEMVTLNDSNVVAFTSGNDDPESIDEGSELDMQGFHLWTKGNGVQNLIRVGDVIGGLTVSAVNAQHPNFRRRYLNQSACAAVQYFVNGVSGGATEDEGEGSGSFPDYGGIAPAGQLFASCGAVCNAPAAPVLGLNPTTAPIGANVTLTWTSTIPAGQGSYDIIKTAGGPPVTIASGIPASASATLTFNDTVVGPAGPQTFQVKAIPSCNPALATLSNTATLTVTGCLKSSPPPLLIVDKPVAPVDTIVTLTWDSPFPGFAGTYTIRFSTDGGATFQDFAAAISGNQFAFQAHYPAGTVLVFEVVADPGCGPAGVSNPSPTVSVQVVQSCPRAGDPVALIDQAQVAVGSFWSLHWTATLPVVGGVTAGIYEVRISRDNAATFQVAGTTTGTTFSGPVLPEDLGKLIFLQVIAKPSCGTGNLSDGGSNTVFFTVLPGVACAAPQAPLNVSIAAAGVSPARPPSPIEYILTSWLGPAGGPVPVRYGVRINGDPEVLTTFNSLILPPRGGRDPITAFVTAYTCGSLISAEVFGGAGTWSPTGSLGFPRQSHTATLLPDGKVLVAGGTSTPFGPAIASAEIFDPGPGSWSPTANLTTARQSHTATALSNGKVLVAGGASAGLAAGTVFQSVAGDLRAEAQLASAELFDPISKTWSAAGNLGTARAQHTATRLSNGKVLVAGGRGAGPLNSVELYDPTTGLWSSTGPLQAARLAHTATLLPNGKVLVAGGAGASGVLASAELYDPSTGTWTPTGNLGTAREGQTATLLPSGKVLVSGGDDGGAPLKGAELYDPTAGTWSATGNLGTARTQHSATLLPGGAVLAAGGSVLQGPSLKSAELYDPAAGTWSAAGSLNGAHGLHSATLLLSGSVLLAGLPDAIGPERASPTAQSATVALFLTPPGTDFTVSPNPVVGQPVTFTDTSNPQATGWLWIFDDGTTDLRQSPTHVFTTAGTHTVALDAANSAGSQTKVKSFVVSAAVAATVSREVELAAFDASDLVRRRATVALGAQGSMWLHVTTQETQETTLFLRFVDKDGALETERRLVVSPGAEAVYDMAAWGLKGTFSVEIVCDRNFSAWIVRTGRPGTKEITR